MRNRLCSNNLLRLAGPALLLAALGLQAASVGLGGYTNDFSAQPATVDFATATIGGGSGDITTAAGLDAAVALLTAASINSPLPAASGSPPGAGVTAVFNDTDKNLQTRPNGAKMCVIMATLLNTTGANARSVRIHFNLLQPIFSSEQVNGVRVYYSLTGLTNSWANIPAVSGTGAGLVSADVTLEMPWTNGITLYLLFADDNGSPSQETANQIDNFFIGISAFMEQLPVVITTQPQDLTVGERQPATFTAVASSYTPITFQWYRGASLIADATNADYTLAGAQVSDSGALFSVVAANVASNVSYTATSRVATLTVLADTNPPTVVEVIPATNSLVSWLHHIEVHFSEGVARVDAADFLINNIPATNVLVLAPDAYVFYFPRPSTGTVQITWATGHGITDLAHTPNAFAGGMWSHTLNPDFEVVLITEFVASNQLGIRDEDDDREDWIEIYNSSMTAVNLHGWQLTDNPADLSMWRFPDVTLASRAYMYLFASGKDRTNLSSRLHTNFKLNNSGGSLVLSRPDGSISSQFLAYPPQEEDIAYGRDANNPADIGYLTPTPGKTNGALFPHPLNDVTFSVHRGFYTAAQILTLTPAIAGSVIKYTTDGTQPAARNGLTYAGPIAVAPETDGVRRGTRRIRAVALHPDAATTKTKTHTYLFVNGITTPAIDGIVSQTAIKTNATNGPLLDDALLSLPYIVINNPAGLPTPGESEASVELIAPGGTESGFQVNCGIQAAAGATVTSPKASFRLYFRPEYGEKEIKYDLFPGHPYDPHGATDRFDRLNLRSGNQDSFYGWVPGEGRVPTYLRNIVMDDLKLQMGDMSMHGRFAHCIVNGQYHGLYHIREYPDEHFFASYLPGGTKLYDWTNGDPASSGGIEGGSSNVVAVWNTIMTYGTTPGTSNYTEFKRRVNVTDLADFLVLTWWAGNADWGPFHNWYAGGPNLPDMDGWRFFSYDNDLTWPPWAVNNVRVGVPSNMIHPLMAAHPEFQQLVRDRAYRHMANGGVLTSEKVRATFEYREREITLAMLAETARWTPGSFDRDIEWRTELDRIKNVYFPGRCATVFAQMTEQGWYPVNAPEFTTQRGGTVAPGHQPVITGTETIYATVDGSDPRLEGGAISPTAFPFTAMSITIQSNMIVRLRSRNSSAEWSALNEATFKVTGPVPKIVVTEIMYHPRDIPEAEFIELKNVGDTTINLFLFKLSGGIDFDFPNLTLAAGQRVIVAANTNAFLARYGAGLLVAGQYSGNLDNAGDHIVLQGPWLETILDFSYQDSWYPKTDGQGYSLQAVNEDDVAADPGSRGYWRSSWRYAGTPGEPDPPLAMAPVVINEILTYPFAPDGDAIELFNPDPRPAAVGGWWLTDDSSVPKKYRIPDGASISAGGYVELRESQFNAAPGASNSFALSAQGESVWLFSADAAGNLTGYAHGFSFGASEQGVSFGRHRTSTGEEEFPAQVAPTLGTNNAGPRVGPVVISEIMYHPPRNGDQFIELRNTTSTNVLLYDPAYPSITWKVAGLDFALPPGSQIPAGGRALLVGLEPSAFRTKYGVPPEVPVFGPFGGALQNNGERIELQWPRPPHSQGIVYVTKDAVRYNDNLPWPTVADGGGPSLQRIHLAAYGNDPVHWMAAAPTPGGEWSASGAPVILTQPRSQKTGSGQAASFGVTAAGNDPLQYQWSYEGQPMAGATQATLILSNVVPILAGDYSVLVFNNAGYEASASARLEVTPQGSIVINEILFNPLVTNAQYVELFNNSTNTAYDLSGWRFDGLNYTFPSGTTMAPLSFLVLAMNRAAFAAAYGSGTFVFGQYAGTLQVEGQTLSLIQPGATPDQDLVVDTVKYESTAPWPALGTNGAPLELMDAAQDNSRVCNWTDGGGWRFASYTGILPTSTLNVYMDNSGDVYLDDVSLVAGTVPAVGSNYIANGDFEQVLTNDWRAFFSATNSSISTNIAHSGGSSLRLVVGNPAGSSARLQQTIAGLILTNTYTLSFWYLPTTGSNGLTTWFNNSPPFKTTLRQMPPTPGTRNAFAGILAPIPPLWLTEVQPVNGNTLQTQAGQYSPWVELYNAGLVPVSLEGLYLANNYTNLTQWAFPTGAVIHPGEFKVLFADGETNQSTLAELHTSFRLTPTNGSIALARLRFGQPEVLDYIHYAGVPANSAYGSVPGGQPFDRILLFHGTPGVSNAGTNTPPVLTPVADLTTGPTKRLVFTNVVTNPDNIPLTFSLGPGAPAGARVNPTNGVFVWRPTFAQAPSTNWVTVWVSASSVPPWSASNTFRIFVGDYVQVGLGSDVVPGGQGTSLPMQSYSSTRLTNMAFTVRPTVPYLTNVAVQPAAPLSATLTERTEGGWDLVIAPPAGQWLQGAQDLGQLEFLVRSNLPSAMVYLEVLRIQAEGAGMMVTNLFGYNGRVVAVENEPLLEAVAGTEPLQSQPSQLILYGNPGSNYVIEAAMGMSSSMNWEPWLTNQLDGLYRVFEGVPLTNQPLFFRVYK